MENKSIKVELRYEDFLGNITESKVERVDDGCTYESEFDTLVDTCKGFLLSRGFTEELINTRIK